ncbi:MAG: hypothetical protein HY658_14925, partial [Actinobacteria bacterium]|nr:hypothetical protein [Actinomycetota bacterium]
MGSAFVTLVAVILAGLFAFQLVPALVLPKVRVANGWLERSVFWFIGGTFITIVAVHFLVAFKAYESIGLIAIWLLVAYFFKIRPAGGLKTVGNRIARLASRTLSFLDRSEAGSVGVAVREEIDSSTGTIGERVKEARLKWSPALILAAIPVAAVILYSFAIRLDLALDSFRLARGDSYFHMAWTTLLQDNRIYTDGIYPHGFHAFLSVWDRFHPGPTFDLIRFAGPLIGGMFSVVLYFVVSRVARHIGAGLVAAGIYGILGMNTDMLQFWNRQISAVPEEFAVLFVPLALYCAIRYVNEGDRQLLAFAAMATGVVAFVHPVPLLFLAVGLGGVAFAALVTGRLVRVPALALWTFHTALAGNIYLVIGALAGTKFYIAFSDFNPFSEDLTPAAESAAAVPLYKLLHGNELYFAAAICAVIAVAIFFVIAVRERRAVGGVALGAFTAAALIGYWQIGPRISPLLSERSGYLAASTIPLAFGLLVGAVLYGISLFLRGGEEEPPEAEGSEDAGRPLRLTRHVGSQLIGAALGVLVLVMVVARDIRLEDARNPGYTIPIPTRDVYI